MKYAKIQNMAFSMFAALAVAGLFINAAVGPAVSLA